MRIHRFIPVGRLAIVMGFVAVAGCSEGAWDSFRTKQSDSSQQQATKARRPVTTDPAVAESTAKPTTPEGDPKSRGVDEQVDRYVQSMNTQYDPSYQNNDVSSKIRRQSDPNRPARVKQTALRSRTESTSDDAAAHGPDDSRDKGAASADSPSPSVIAQSDAEKQPAKPQGVSKESDSPGDVSHPAASESAMKPPVLAAVTIAASPIGVDAKPPEEKSSGPTQEHQKPVEAPAVEAKPPDRMSAEEKSGQSAAIESEPKKSAPPPAPVESDASKDDEKQIDASNSDATPIENPQVESPRAEIRKPEPAPVKSEPIKSAIETPKDTKRPKANTPSSSMPPTPPADSFKQKLREQISRVAQNPDDVEEQFKLRMMYLVDGQDDKALAPSSSMNAQTQEILLGQIRALIAARSSTSRDPAVWANKQLEAIEKLRAMLRAKADLMVPKVELCKSIESFGRYEPFEPAVFKAGGKNRVLLYIEVDNFKCERTKTGLFRTLLSVRQSLLNKGGEELWSAKDDNIEDLARQARRDFYLTIGPLAIPKTLGPGEYLLKVEVEDVLGGKINSNVARFKMVP